MAVLKSNLSSFAGGMSGAVSRALLQTGKDVFAISQQFVPIDKGDLKQSGGVVPVSSYTLHIGYGTDHAIFQELGTIHQPAQPYLTPAMAQAQTALEKRLEEEINKLT